MQEAQRMMGGSYQESDLARASLVQMSEIARRAEAARMSFPNVDPHQGGGGGGGEGMGGIGGGLRALAEAQGLMPGEDVRGLSREDLLARIEEVQRERGRIGSPLGVPNFGGVGGFVNLAGLGGVGSQGQGQGQDGMAGAYEGGSGEGVAGMWPDQMSAAGAQMTQPGGDGPLQVFTVGHLLPKSVSDDPNGNWTYDAEMPPDSTSPDDDDAPLSSEFLSPPSSEEIPRPSSTSQKLRVRRSTFVPGWAVPPRVLLVDDDAVNRKLSSKFLQIAGCTIDVAVDGVGAVNKMNLEKYDLVLMVRPSSSSFPSIVSPPYVQSG